jgi:hypothetical protein
MFELIGFIIFMLVVIGSVQICAKLAVIGISLWFSFLRGFVYVIDTVSNYIFGWLKLKFTTPSK